MTIIKSNSRIAWLTIVHDELTTAWLQKHLDGEINTDPADGGFEEITTIPFWSNGDPQPNATPGLFAPS